MAIRRAWTEWSAVEAKLRTTREFVGRMDQVLSIVDKMEHAGEMARTEARLFRIQKATKLAEMAGIESHLRGSQLRLCQLLGISPDASVSFQSSGIGPTLATNPNRSSEHDRAAVESNSPAMIVAAAAYEAAERALELEIRKQYPDLHIGPGYGREDGQDQVLLGLSVPFPLLNGNRRGIAEARARRELARADAETTLEQLIANLRAAEVRQQAARTQRQTIESEIIPLVDAQYTDSREMARLGEVNTLILLESLSRQQEAKINLIAALQAEVLAGIDIDELVGPPSNPGESR